MGRYHRQLRHAGATCKHQRTVVADIVQADFAFMVRPNRVLDNAATHARKAERVKALWPELVIIPWDA